MRHSWRRLGTSQGIRKERRSQKSEVVGLLRLQRKNSPRRRKRNCSSSWHLSERGRGRGNSAKEGRCNAFRAPAPRAIRQQAEKLLQECGAIGRLPTPVNELVATAKLSIEHDVSLDSTFLGRLYKKLPGPLKRAIDKVLGLLDPQARRIYLDHTTHEKKKPFLSLHEVGHDYLPWQRDTYAILEDSETSLDPDTKDAFEREANCFACEVLFQLDKFRDEAADCDFSIKTPLKLSKRYGSSFYAAARRFVTTHRKGCAVIVFEKPTFEIGTGYTLILRRSAESPEFIRRFGVTCWKDAYVPGDLFARIVPHERKFTRPTACKIRNLNGDYEECLVEVFDSTFELFYLVCPINELKPAKKVILV